MFIANKRRDHNKLCILNAGNTTNTTKSREILELKMNQLAGIHHSTLSLCFFGHILFDTSS